MEIPPPYEQPPQAPPAYEPSHVYDPAATAGASGPQENPAWARKLGPLGSALLAILAVLKQVGTLLLTLFKFAKLSKFLLTGGSMLVSIWVYAMIFGWWFGVGVVVSIFVHEMGHVAAAATQGVPVSAPVFIPGMGALILQKKSAKTAFSEALIGIGGPIGGTLAALVCVALWLITGNPLFRGLAYFGFFINLFNMMPIYPLDGGWIVGAIHPYLWAAGVAIMAVLMVKGYTMGPFLLILIIMGLPRLWYGIKTGSSALPGQEEATLSQRVIMGISYVSLVLFLAVGMRLLYDPSISLRRQRLGRPPEQAEPAPTQPVGSPSGQVVFRPSLAEVACLDAPLRRTNP